jgi:hypothetical protein
VSWAEPRGAETDAAAAAKVPKYLQPQDLSRQKASKNKDKVTEAERGHARKYQREQEPFNPKPLGEVTKADSPRTAKAKKKKAEEEAGERQVQAEEREVARLIKKAERTQRKQDREDKKKERSQKKTKRRGNADQARG